LVAQAEAGETDARERRRRNAREAAKSVRPHRAMNWAQLRWQGMGQAGSIRRAVRWEVGYT
jgi:hypothetical protein